MTSFYNDIDPFVTRWLRNLVASGNLPPGKVCTDSIEILSADILPPHNHCHFFAGIGGWPLALSLVGWPDNYPVWTGSCPCQPFSVSGSQKGTNDPRHLFPAWLKLIEQCRPTTIFGEQVASPLGRTWLDNVSVSLEKLGYSFAAADLCAAGVGAPHIRQRLFWVAYSNSKRLPRIDTLLRPENRKSGRQEEIVETSWSGEVDYLPCLDGKTRPVESGTLPLAYGISGGLGLEFSNDGEVEFSSGREERENQRGRLIGYGNSIVVPLAVEFILAFLESVEKPDLSINEQQNQEAGRSKIDLDYLLLD